MNKPPALQIVMDNQATILRGISRKLDTLIVDDQLPPYRAPLANWQVALRRDRANEPGVCSATHFKPAKDANGQIKCTCHDKPMLMAWLHGEPRPLCTFSAWFALAKASRRDGSWRTMPQKPELLYKMAANGNSKGKENKNHEQK